MKVWIVMSHYDNFDLGIEGEYPKKVFGSLQSALDYMKEKTGVDAMDQDTVMQSGAYLADDGEHNEYLYTYADGFEVC